jgi:hypothetical protein
MTAGYGEFFGFSREYLTIALGQTISGEEEFPNAPVWTACSYTD